MQLQTNLDENIMQSKILVWNFEECANIQLFPAPIAKINSYFRVRRSVRKLIDSVCTFNRDLRGKICFACSRKCAALEPGEVRYEDFVADPGDAVALFYIFNTGQGWGWGRGGGNLSSESESAGIHKAVI